MLIRFGFSNHRSFADAVEISFVASALRDEGVDLLSSPESPNSLIPAALVYGANASGKTNIISALGFMQSAVLRSHTSNSPTGGVPRQPFLLDTVFRQEPSEFTLDFVVEGIRYHYGFRCNDQLFLEEWLYSFQNNRRSMMFERSDEGKVYSYGRDFKGQNKTIESLTRQNSLYVSTGAQNNHDILISIFKFFEDLIIFTDIASHISVMVEEADDFDERIIRFLSLADPGIVSHALGEKKTARSELAKSMLEDLERVFRKHAKGGNFPKLSEFDNLKELRLGHMGSSEEPVFMPFDTESRGTQRVISLLGPIYDALDAGKIVIIDELDASLHSYVCMEIVGLFATRVTNPHGAQLLATTHDTNLLSQSWLRRDQVWFVEKVVDGKSNAYPLTDYKIKKTDNIERGYLRGRYGAVPTKLHN